MFSAPDLVSMENLYMDLNSQGSRQSRSRSSSYPSSTNTQFQSLNLHSPSSTTDSCLSIHPSSDICNTDRLFSAKDSTATATQQYSNYPLFSGSGLDANWNCLSSTGQHSASSAPLLGLDPSKTDDNQLFGDQRSIRANSDPTTMSTLGIQQFDNRFDASIHGGLRHTYTWPQFEVPDQFISQHTSSGLNSGQLTSNLYDDPKLMPMYAKSLSSSPPRANLTAEMRDLKRQQTHVRRESKSRVRRGRSMSTASNHYHSSQAGSPDSLPIPIVPEYPSALNSSPLISQVSLQSSPALSNSNFLTPYSPPLNTQPPTDMYGPAFAMPNNFTTAPAFTMPFSHGGDQPSLACFVGRPHSLSVSSLPDQTAIYRAQTQQISPRMVSSSESGDHVRVVHSRPKPQCWEHGCNGRQFSTFSNLLRHQREKSGAAQKSSCPNCGAEFTRTTARNGHMAHDKCKSRRNT